MDEPADLFTPRLIEFGETRRETIVAARPFVREELVVGKEIARRVERIDETVRRTEVEVEDLPPGTGGTRS
jgi:stress response protein YsnF